MDKFICNKCHYSLTIRKTTDNVKTVQINSGAEIVSAFNQDENMNYDVKLSEDDLNNYLSKSKIKDDKKKDIINFYTKLQKNHISKYILKCTSCGENYRLEPETIIYSLNLKKQNLSFNDDYIDLKLYDPTLPRTKDYICVNEKCETNSKGFDLSNKEAVFFRANKSYNLKYACLNCKTCWAN